MLSPSNLPVSFSLEFLFITHSGVNGSQSANSTATVQRVMHKKKSYAQKNKRVHSFHDAYVQTKVHLAF